MVQQWTYTSIAVSFMDEVKLMLKVNISYSYQRALASITECSIQLKTSNTIIAMSTMM